MGVVSHVEAQKLGLSKPMLSRLAASGRLLRIRRGYYVHPDSKLDPRHYDFIVACRHFGPNSVIGGLSALFYRGLTEQAPKKVWVLVPYDQKTKHSLYRLIRTRTKPKVGVEDHGRFRIANLERTIIEGLRYASKIGARTAIRAARTAIADGRTSEMKLARQATELGLRAVIERYWDAIAS